MTEKGLVGADVLVVDGEVTLKHKVDGETGDEPAEGQAVSEAKTAA